MTDKLTYLAQQCPKLALHLLQTRLALLGGLPGHPVGGEHRLGQDAAALVVVLSKKSYEYNDRTEVLHSHSFEAGAAFMALSLEGTARGLAVHAMGGFDDAKVREVIGLTGNEEYQVEAVLAVGNPKAGGVEYITKRREVEQFTSEGKFVEKVEAKPFF
ncbi:hypothetical protein TYRP_020383 [Tyrophagus putrescentiae]|nr:hypothetical protein TYRP_020383 [Tyrophagus putrescentiae]